MQQLHPVYGDLVVSDERLDRGRWMSRDASVPLDTVLDLIDEGWTVEEILQRHILILRADLIDIMMLHGLTGR